MTDPLTGQPKPEHTLSIEDIAPQPLPPVTPPTEAQASAAALGDLPVPSAPPASPLPPQVNLHPGQPTQSTAQPTTPALTATATINPLQHAQPATAAALESSVAEQPKPQIDKTKRLLHAIGFGLAGFLLFIVVFNFQLISQQIGYFLHPPKPAQSLNLQDPNAKATTAAIVPPDNLIIIPKINVSAPVVFADTIADDVVLKDLESGVVHYVNTANPGEKGNAVIFGHSSNDWWEPGNYKFVFALLEKLAVGDQIQINYSSRKYVYQVSEMKVVAPTEVSVLNQTPDPTLTLITCTPPGTSWKRLIVIAKQIEPVPTDVNTTPALADAAAAKKAGANVKPLPGNAPSLGDQVTKFFNGVISFLKPKSAPSQSPTTPTRAYLPDVS